MPILLAVDDDREIKSRRHLSATVQPRAVAVNGEVI
jgi:hypothetical protein